MHGAALHAILGTASAPARERGAPAESVERE
eukprot:CAMPEP_0170317420 /NCGR_PEP_ID=MMETSP0116_2-20130129/59379_1 /TAXON_ID=400756 /ORGANISM="Durinskia baltica, Strain CSIRO CS-38" /LENGTH=30 /DNA_ID= /DNA_START= /DNA_END= /DNA_ORIENTATION=